MSLRGRVDTIAKGKKITNNKPEINVANVDAERPLAPPPKPSEAGDYFSSQLSLEPNPFEQSFRTGGTVETPGGTKLPSVAALTSPSSLLPGTGTTPFNWGGGSLRTGPLSPAMLSGPANDYFGDTSHITRGTGFTPNESSLRTGLTPGGSGSMFPAASPNSQALFAQLASGGATPSTLDFHRTAMSAAAAKQQQSRAEAAQASQAAVTSAPEGNAPAIKAEAKPASGSFDPHDNDAANGLFMLAQGAQGRSNAPTQPQQYPVGGTQAAHGHSTSAHPGQANTSPRMNGNGAALTRGASEASGASDGSEAAKPSLKGKGKRGSTGAVNGRRKADEPPIKQPPSKKTKTALSEPMEPMSDEEMSDDEDDDAPGPDGKPKPKMTDEEKRKNFLERNRYVYITILLNSIVDGC